MLQIGENAPNFNLKNQNGENVSLENFKGKWVVLYFYPKALTPGCTVQACALSDHKADLEALNAVALGISADKTSLLKSFETKKNLNFTLLSDLSENKDTLKAYHAFGPKKFMGREYDGIHRITYIISPEGKVAESLAKVNTKTHHEDVINILQNLQK